jgi:hypothetical protein
MVAIHVLSARYAQNENPDETTTWTFGVLLDQAVEGHQRWIVETADPVLIAQLHSAYREKSHTSINIELLVDAAINAVD